MKKVLMILLATTLLVGLVGMSALAAPKGHDGPSYRPEQQRGPEVSHRPESKPQPQKGPEVSHRPEPKPQPQKGPKVSYRPAPQPQPQRGPAPRPQPQRGPEPRPHDSGSVVIHEDDGDLGSFIFGVILGSVLD